MTGNDHKLVGSFCNVISAFGIEWRKAPGEAEAELAYLNRVGIIDAIITDDVDAFVFGAVTVIRKCVYYFDNRFKSYPYCLQYSQNAEED